MDYRIQYSDFPPQHPLADAVHLVLQAFLIAQKHMNERVGRYTQQDIHLFMRLRDAVWMHYFRFAELVELACESYATQEKSASEVVKNGRCVDSKLEK